MHAGFPETYSKITFTTNSTFAKIVLVLKYDKVGSLKIFYKNFRQEYLIIVVSPK